MWDVIWTDPDKELVGEHRAKKASVDSRSKKKPSDPRSGRNSVSTTSSISSSMEISLSIFRTGRGLKRINAAAAAAAASGNQMTAMASGAIGSPSIASTCTRSPLSRSTFDDGSSRQSSDRASASIFEHHGDDSPAPGKKADSACNISPSPSNNESIFSILPADISATTSLDHSSPMTETEKIKSIIQLLELSDPPAETSRYFETKEPDSQKKDNTFETRSPAAPLTPPRSPSHPSKSRMNVDVASSPPLAPPLKSPFRMTAPKWSIPMMSMSSNPDSWRPQAAPTPVSPPKSSVEIVNEILNSELPDDEKKIDIMTPSLDHLRDDVVKMASTGPREMLARLCELWERSKGMRLGHLLGGSEDVLEMRRWMLSAMNHLDLPVSSRKAVQLDAQSSRMVLVLYESSITVTYLAAIHPSKQFYDISPSSSSSNPYENLNNARHISISSISPHDFPVAPRIFEAVVSHTLTSQCPTPLLENILHAAYRSLKPGGALLLTLIDPLPRAGTMGPRMKAWLEDHLLRNLARTGRCMSPSTVFPRILGRAHLRGKGSTLTTTKFYALPHSATSLDHDDYYNDHDTNRKMELKAQEESEVKAQVRSLVGRTLWTQVWGPHVTAERWWWEEEACVHECLQLGTFWEYHSIRAVKSATPN